LEPALEAGKSSAYGTSGIRFAGWDDCLIYPSGKAPLFRWHLQFPEFHLFVSRREQFEGETPNAFASLNAQTLWGNWLAGSMIIVQQRLAMLGGVTERMKPSRCDLCADFHIPSRVSVDYLHSRRVPRHYETRTIMAGEDLETWYVGGTKSPVRLRIYDKGREILKSQKLWFADIWERDSVHDVWRVEFQLRREFLRRFKIESLDDLEQRLRPLWEYLTCSWFELREHDDSHTTRRTVAPWWRAVQDVARVFGEQFSLERRELTPTADVAWYVAHIAGCLKGVAARRRKDRLDDALEDLEALLRAHIDTTAFAEAVRVKSLQLGFPIGDAR
jgi:hypothetical protein